MKKINQLNKFAIPLLFQMLATYFIGAKDVAIVGSNLYLIELAGFINLENKGFRNKMSF